LVLGIAERRSQARLSAPAGYFNDESAQQPAWKETVNIVRPAVSQIINVSSVAPGDFADECLLEG